MEELGERACKVVQLLYTAMQCSQVMVTTAAAKPLFSLYRPQPDIRGFSHNAVRMSHFVAEGHEERALVASVVLKIISSTDAGFI